MVWNVRAIPILAISWTTSRQTKFGIQDEDVSRVVLKPSTNETNLLAVRTKQKWYCYKPEIVTLDTNNKLPSDMTQNDLNWSDPTKAGPYE